jgi:hypothetical protein
MEELHLTARQLMQLWDHVKKIENFWSTLSELEPGSSRGSRRRRSSVNGKSSS